MQIDRIEEKLKALPKPALSNSADFAIRRKLGEMQAKPARIFGGRLVFRYFKLSLASALLFVLVVVPAYAYASPTVTSGDMLYPLKTGLESVELALSFSDAGKVKTLEKIADRRLEEAQLISEKNDAPDKLASAVNEAMKYKEKAVIKSRAAAEDLAKLDQNMEKADADNLKKLENVARNIGVADNEDIIDAVALAIDRIKNGEIKRTAASDSQKIATGTKPVRSGNQAEADSQITPASKSNAAGSKPTITAKLSNNALKLGSLGTEEAEAYFQETKQRMENLKVDLSKDELDNGDVNKLFEKLQDKMDRAQTAIKQKDYIRVNDILKSANALGNNARHFIRQSGSDIKTKTEIKDKQGEIKNGNSNKE